MRLGTTTLMAAAITLAASGSALSQGVEVADSAMGMALVDDHGMMLYTLDNDMPGESTCTPAWPNCGRCSRP